MSAHTQEWQQANLLTGRQMVLAVTIALHALVIGALMTVRNMPQIKQVAERNWITPITPPDEPIVEPPTQVPVKVVLAPIHIPIPVVPIEIPVVNVPEATALQVPVGPAEADAAAVSAPDLGMSVGAGDAGPVIATTALQYRAVRPADDYYPDASLKLQEAGTAIVQVCVAPTGRMEGAPTIQTSSGSSRLDAAALRWAREALRFTPATRGGVPVSACKGFRVNFRLR